jgi:hypothetical protein
LVALRHPEDWILAATVLFCCVLLGWTLVV